MLGAWVANPSLGAENGTDIVIGVMYAPVILPLGLLLFWIDDVVRTILSLVSANLDLGSGLGQAVTVWLTFSIIAAAQSYVLAVVSRKVHAWKARRQLSQRRQ
jgi:hypothetical protein